MSRFSFFTTAELRAAGETRATIREKVAGGYLFRVIRGWYGTAETPKQAVFAMRVGGRLGCVSALELYGAWVPPESGTHVVFATAASGRRSAGRPRGASVVRHWSAPDDRTGSAFAVAPLDLAITDALKCLPPHLAIAVLDSLLHRRLISRNRLEAVLARGPKRTRFLAGHLEARSESGIESIVRFLLRVIGLDVEVQVRMRGRDRVDILVGDWLVIECDGRETHAQQEAFTKDRERVVRLMRESRIVVQFAYATIMYDFAFVQRSVEEVVQQFAPLG